MASKNPTERPAELLARLEDRHDDLLNRLDELNEQIDAVLAELSGGGTPAEVG